MTGRRHRQGALRLLTAEVIQELILVRDYLLDNVSGNSVPPAKILEEVKHKAAYISTLSLAERNHNFDLAASEKNDYRKRLFRGLASICSRLNRLSDMCLNITRQQAHLKQRFLLKDYDLDAFFDEIISGVNTITSAIDNQKIDQALLCADIEEKIDQLYANHFARIIKELESGGCPGELVTILMISHYLERMGDVILEIGEDLIFIMIGEKLKIGQYRSLKAGLSASGHNTSFQAGDFRSIWSGRSGCRLGLIGSGSEDKQGHRHLIFKHGPADKLLKERDNLQLWSRKWPGLTPDIEAFVADDPKGREASLVLEYLQGPTLRDLFTNPAGCRAQEKLEQVLHLMARVWRQSRVDKTTQALFCRQAERRLGSLKALHPSLVKHSAQIGHIKILAVPEILAQAAKAEESLSAPFSVRIHGDFNLSNIICASDGSVKLIDLYRSRITDYAQDLSVMMLSIIRLPISRKTERTGLSAAARQVWDFAVSFADENGDELIRARLAFGLARSYLTSARFEPNKDTALRFINYASYIWNKLLAHHSSGRPWQSFSLDKKALYL